MKAIGTNGHWRWWLVVALLHNSENLNHLKELCFIIRRKDPLAHTLLLVSRNYIVVDKFEYFANCG